MSVVKFKVISMRVIFNLILFLIIFLHFGVATAQNLNSDQLQGIKEFNTAINEQEKSTLELKKLQIAVIQFGRQRKLDCESAFGNEKFCTCLNENLPAIITFEEYINIIAANKNELLKLATDKGKGAIKGIFAARDNCVALHVNH